MGYCAIDISENLTKKSKSKTKGLLSFMQHMI